MRRSAKLLLWVGCALVLALEGPPSLRALAAGWGGPYDKGSKQPVSLAARAAKRPVGGLELARRE